MVIECGRCRAKAEACESCADANRMPVGWTLLASTTHSHPVRETSLVLCDACVGPGDRAGLFICTCGVWSDYSRGIVGDECSCPIPTPLAPVGASEGSEVA